MSAAEELLKPFPFEELKFFPVAISREGNMGKVGTYVDARAVMNRLDAVVGPGGWQTEYRLMDDGTKAVECRLSVRLDEGWVTKADVGYPNEGKDADNADKEPLKAAYSDALKRAAVQFGIGRHIYDLQLERDWLPVDQYKKFTETPQLKGAGPTRSSAPAAASPQAQRSAIPPASSPTPAPGGAAQPRLDPGSKIDQLGEFRAPNGTPNLVAFRQHLADQTVSVKALNNVLEKAAAGTVGEWLQANPDKTMRDLSALSVEAQREMEQAAVAAGR